MMDERRCAKSSPREEGLDARGFVVVIWSVSGVALDREDVGVDVMSLHCFNPQFFICSRVGDAALEADRGGLTLKFPQEMNIVIDAVRALAAAVPLGHLLPGDRLALDRLQGLSQGMGQTGTGDDQTPALTTAEVDDLIARLRRLRREDPESADRILRRLNEEGAVVPARPESPPTGGGR
jgi:hypothetical protein